MPKPPSDPLASLRARVAKAPQEAGIYKWLNAKGEVLYVGKAKNLRARLKNYVQKNPDKSLGPWKLSLIGQIADLDVTVVNSELEALVLETNLIKELRPKYNVLMKDDKNYVYVRITMGDTYPRVDVVRQMEKDGAKYFGPKPSAYQVREALGVLRKIFPFRTCKMGIELGVSPSPLTPLPEGEGEHSGAVVSLPPQGEGSGMRGIPLDVICTHRDRPTPCLDHHIGQCSAPCIGRKTPEEYYKESIEGVVRFFKGDHDAVKELLQERMKQAAINKQFERAAELRDSLKHIDELQEKQLVSDTSGEDGDFIGVAVLSNRAQVSLFQRRGGKVIGESSFALGGQVESIAEVLEQFLPQYYQDCAEFPSAVYIGEDIPERAVMEAWLSLQANHKVAIHIPERGTKSKLLELAEKNAQQKAKQAEIKWESETRNTEEALGELKEKLHLPEGPQRIEGYDISHHGGTETVGSMVVMKRGKPANAEYRSFTIHTMKSGMIDDYRSLKEVLTRRLRHLDEEREEKKWAAKGVLFKKPVKADETALRELKAGLGIEDGIAIDAKECMTAKADDPSMNSGQDKVVAWTCLHLHEGGIMELALLWADAKHAKDKLDLALARRMLQKLKKGKVYAFVHPGLESRYSEIGFRYIVKPPPAVLTLLETRAKTTDGACIAMLYEVLQHKADSSLSSRPDLLVIDGGKGQLSTVVEVLKSLELEIPVIGLAKREEEIFLPNESFAVPFAKDSPAKFLLMRLRDEAHRFANRHRERRGARAMKGSLLDTVAGIGPETKKILLKQFGSVDQIFAASDDALGKWISSEQIQALRNAIV